MSLILAASYSIIVNYFVTPISSFAPISCVHACSGNQECQHAMISALLKLQQHLDKSYKFMLKVAVLPLKKKLISLNVLKFDAGSLMLFSMNNYEIVYATVFFSNVMFFIVCCHVSANVAGDKLFTLVYWPSGPASAVPFLFSISDFCGEFCRVFSYIVYLFSFDIPLNPTYLFPYIFFSCSVCPEIGSWTWECKLFSQCSPQLIEFFYFSSVLYSIIVNCLCTCLMFCIGCITVKLWDKVFKCMFKAPVSCVS